MCAGRPGIVYVGFEYMSEYAVVGLVAHAYLMQKHVFVVVEHADKRCPFLSDAVVMMIVIDCHAHPWKSSAHCTGLHLSACEYSSMMTVDALSPSSLSGWPPGI